MLELYPMRIIIGILLTKVVKDRCYLKALRFYILLFGIIVELGYV